jgi:hypothetical protein
VDGVGPSRVRPVHVDGDLRRLDRNLHRRSGRQPGRTCRPAVGRLPRRLGRDCARLPCRLGNPMDSVPKTPLGHSRDRSRRFSCAFCQRVPFHLVGGELDGTAGHARCDCPFNHVGRSCLHHRVRDRTRSERSWTNRARRALRQRRRHGDCAWHRNGGARLSPSPLRRRDAGGHVGGSENCSRSASCSPTCSASRAR